MGRFMFVVTLVVGATASAESTTASPDSQTSTTTEAPLTSDFPMIEIVIVLLAILLLIFAAARLGSLIRTSGTRNVLNEIDPVACAVCTLRQGVPRSANVFVCYSCHSANFLQRDRNGDPATSSSPTATGSGRRMVVTKLTDTFYKVEDDREASEVHHNDATNNDQSAIMDPSLLSPKTDRKGFTGEESCTVCMDNNADTVMLPCSHGGICYCCADAIVRRSLLNGGALCPHCRTPIASLIKLSDANEQVARGEEVRIPRAYMLTRRGAA